MRPLHHRPCDLPGGPLRRRAGLGALPRGGGRPRRRAPDGQGGRAGDGRRRGARPAASAATPSGWAWPRPSSPSTARRSSGSRYLRPLYTGEEKWCQLFSEPGAGSDLAALATRAVLDGEEWVCNGQKVWTTLAHKARWGLLVARTDPNQPKHRGLTYFVLDMQAPGVEVVPLRQMTGEAEFNEVYLTDARIPDSMRLGDVGDGWRVAMTTLMNERVAIGESGTAKRGSGTISPGGQALPGTPARPGGPRRPHAPVGQVGGHPADQPAGRPPCAARALPARRGRWPSCRSPS